MSGDFDPARWKLYRWNNQDAGVLLMNDHPEQSSWELVYLGVAHDCRGHDLGRRCCIRDLSRPKRPRGRRFCWPLIIETSTPENFMTISVLSNAIVGRCIYTFRNGVNRLLPCSNRQAVHNSLTHRKKNQKIRIASKSVNLPEDRSTRPGHRQLAPTDSNSFWLTRCTTPIGSCPWE